MYGSPVPKDLNLPAQPPPMASSGLLRYRSAPSAVLGGLCEDQLQIPAAPGAAAADNVFSRFLTDDKPSPTPAHFASAADMASQHQQQQQMMFHSQSQSQQQTGRSGGGLYRTVSSGIEAGGAAASSLIRQSSSPAGFLDHFGMDNGYGAMLRASMGMGFQDGGASDSLAGGGGSGRLGGQLSFSSRQGSLMSQISEMDSQDQEEDVGASSPDAAGGRGAAYIPGYPMSSAGWDDSSAALLPDSLPATTKRPRDSSEHGGGLAHQFSLPKTSSSSEMAAIEKFLQFQQDAVPCKVRAKRGCATHPRSIAERVRRTKISERIRKLQELVPDMDKQTNTSDMLDLAVDYIKDLQKQVKALNESRASCTCPASKHQQFSG